MPIIPGEFTSSKIILADCGLIDPGEIDHYLARDGYSGLAKVLATEPDQVIAEIKESKLRGRGGAGFPTGVKWETCKNAPGTPKYMICNADEGDPGAFMDRALLESNPHQLLEGLTIAAYTVGAEQAYIYVRAEYPLAVKRLQDRPGAVPGAGGCWAGTSWEAGSTWRSKCFRVRAPLCAGRRLP